MRKMGLLSIVLPCHNEEDALPTTYQRLTRILGDLTARGRCRSYELIFVDNGSTDQTLAVLEKLFESDAHVRIVSLRRNFGYQGSYSAGLASVRGDAAITIDADLQDPPELIDEMIGHYEKEYDLVLGIRQDRSADSFLKRFFSENFYRLLRMLGVEAVHNHGDFRLMSRGIVDAYNALPERNRFIRAMVLQLDSRYATVTYRREVRKAGQSKFNISALFSLSLDGVISFSYMPLRIASLAGIFMCFASLIGVAWVLYLKLASEVSVPGWASTMLPIFGLSGFQLLVLGLMGEYIGRLYIEVKQRPIFLVRKEYSRGSETTMQGK